MIDPKLFTVDSILDVLLLNGTISWHKDVEIIVGYMPTYPRKDTKPRCVVKYTQDNKEEIFLRYSCGPKQGHFWDIYGDDYQTPELALIAITEAPNPPPSSFVYKFTIQYVGE